MSKAAVCNWDFTLKEEGTDFQTIKETLIKYCKNWSFQLEKGKETGYKHYQGRVSLKVKDRKPPFFQKMGCHWTPTSNENRDNHFYVTKEDTRLLGPWSDKDPEVYIPRQYKNIDLKLWQARIKASAEVFEPRKINLIYDPNGGIGKSTIAAICELEHGGIDMPPLNDFKELIQLLCNILTDTNNRKPKIIFFDLPRALCKDKLNGLYCAIEQVKKGKVYDLRYHYKCWWFDSPQIWVFSNHLPDPSLLSQDRWNIWTIDENDGLAVFGAKAVTIKRPKKIQTKFDCII